MVKAENYSEADFISGLSGLYLLNLEDNQKAMSPGGELYTTGDFISAFYFNRGQLSRRFNIDEIISPEYLPQNKE